MVLVKVLRISSFTDPETGKAGKQIELVEARQRQGMPFIGVPGIGAGSEEAKLVKNIVDQFRSMGVFPAGRELTLPKLTLFLTETEYDMLGIRFEVNDVYDLIMKDGAFMMKKTTEGI
ncbi:MAG: arcadin 1 [Thaumarchaeota archaeon]|nr:arcadin 1 [Nitrososphaerota archaeon]MCL5318999.1 arcadin 1 [Nitrososphaerota archaeon]